MSDIPQAVKGYVVKNIKYLCWNLKFILKVYDTVPLAGERHSSLVNCE